MARFENLTDDELNTLRVALSKSGEQINDDIRAFLLGQVEQQITIKREREAMREDAASDADTKSSVGRNKKNPSSK